MESLLNMLIGDLTLSPEMLFVARSVALYIVVEALTALLSAVVPLARINK